MNKGKLLKLADLLEADAKKAKGIRFDIATWGTVGDKRSPLSCGTTACAMGLAALSRAFADDGLRANVTKEGAVQISLAGQAHGGFDSARKLFRINSMQSSWLFSPVHYSRPARGARGEMAVARRIRDFVAGKASP